MRLYTIALFPLIEPNDDGVKESSSAIIDKARLGRSWPAILKEYDTLTLAAFAGACVTMTVNLDGLDSEKWDNNFEKQYFRILNFQKFGKSG